VDGICDFLHVNMNSKFTRERWRNILDYDWRPGDADCGRIVVDGERIVGFLGLIYADRDIDGRMERFCNASSWYLLRSYRGQGLGEWLLRDAVADTDITYTNLTPTAVSALIFKKQGFQVLDAEHYLLRRRVEPNSAAAQLIDLASASDEDLGTGQRIWRDHSSFNLRHILARINNRSCYLVLSVKKKGDNLAYHDLMYASDLAFVAKHGQDLADHLLPANDAVLAIDRRFLPETPPTAWVERIPFPRLYRSLRLEPKQIDHLYSEIVLLDLKLP
jgi:GNAT superfamily N-acetyltransferase